MRYVSFLCATCTAEASLIQWFSVKRHLACLKNWRPATYLCEVLVLMDHSLLHFLVDKLDREASGLGEEGTENALGVRKKACYR